jgi:hypothetical protein
MRESHRTDEGEPRDRWREPLFSSNNQRNVLMHEVLFSCFENVAGRFVGLWSFARKNLSFLFDDFFLSICFFVPFFWRKLFRIAFYPHL